MKCATVFIQMPLNLLGRDVHRLVYRLQEIKSDVHFRVIGKDDKTDRCVNAKSLIGMFSAGIEQGADVMISCHHEETEQVRADIKKVVDIINELSVMDNEL